MYITTGKFVGTTPYTSNYTYRHIYYKSIQTKTKDYLTTHDYIWRWDTDWFWCSKGFGVQNPLLRLLVGKFMLNSKAYWKIRTFVRKHKFLNKLAARGKNLEPVIQDIEVPIKNASAFLEFFQEEIKISPIWVCPVKALTSQKIYPLYSLEPHQLYVNFGFWDSVESKKEPGYYNKLIEQKVENLGGKKSLYSDSFYSAEKFAKLYNEKAYKELKQKYDPSGMFKTLYDKVSSK
jgi:FAD/FMN-containing dehydrogenase